MLTIEICLQKYNECKQETNSVPEYREFLKFAGIDRRQFARLFGSEAFTKLQRAAGDKPNKLELERTPIDAIMRQYGELVVEVGVIPVYADWDCRGLRPTESGLSKSPHKIKWSELPEKFVGWVTSNNVSGFEQATEIITRSAAFTAVKPDGNAQRFLRLIKDVREWSPARRRNTEAEYKIELRKHLEFVGHNLNEEFGESKFDLLVQGSYAIELKKDPDLAEYDRLFGQVARHLEHQSKIIILVMEATRGDKYDSFAMLVDKYLNRNSNSVELIKK